MTEEEIELTKVPLHQAQRNLTREGSVGSQGRTRELNGRAGVDEDLNCEAAHEQKERKRGRESVTTVVLFVLVLRVKEGVWLVVSKCGWKDNEKSVQMSWRTQRFRTRKSARDETVGYKVCAATIAAG